MALGSVGKVDFIGRHLSSATTSFPSSWVFSSSQQCIGGAKQRFIRNHMEHANYFPRMQTVIVADPDAEVIALSPEALMATNRFVCEIYNKGFQQDQNLQLHGRGHNLLWKLKQRSGEEVKKRVYVCPETTCVHHDPSRALGDLTGIKKHFCRKHGKKWKCKVFKEFVHGICRNLCTSVGIRRKHGIRNG